METELLSPCADAVVAQPGNEHVIALEPEFIIPRMGRRNRIARSRREALDREAWEYLAKLGVTILGMICTVVSVLPGSEGQALALYSGLQARIARILYESVDYLAAQGYWDQSGAQMER